MYKNNFLDLQFVILYITNWERPAGRWPQCHLMVTGSNHNKLLYKICCTPLRMCYYTFMDFSTASCQTSAMKGLIMFNTFFNTTNHNAHVIAAQDAYNLKAANAAKAAGLLPRSAAWDNFMTAYFVANPTKIFG